MNSTKRGQGSTKIQVIHAFASISLVGLYLFLVLQSDHLYHIGRLWESPTILVFVGAEILRMQVNRHLFGIDGNSSSTKESTTKQKPRSYMSTIKDVVKIGSLLGFASLVFAFFSIVLGAPALHSYQNTFALAFLLTTLTLLPLCLHLGAGGVLRLMFGEDFQLKTDYDAAYYNLMKHNAIVTIVGAWGGSVVVPLDWDRDWQAYPIPNMIGAIAGFGFANALAVAQIGAGFFKEMLRKHEYL